MKKINNYLKKYQKLDNVVLMIFSLSILALPSNLSKTWRPASAYFQGIFVELWAPKLYLSQILLFLTLLGVLIFTAIKRSSLSSFFSSTSLKARNRPFLSRRDILLISIVSILTLQILVSRHPAHSLSWVFGAFSAYTLFIIGKKDVFIRHLPSFLLASTTFQSALGLYQFFFQKSLLPYTFLGETQLAQTFTLAKSTLWPQLIVLPYGTTPHPNILAAWLLLGIGALFLLKNLPTRLKLPLLILHLVVLFLTESVSAWLTLPFILFITLFPQRFLSLKRIIVLGTALLSALIWTALPVVLAKVTPTPLPPSISRRAKPLEELLQHPRQELLIGAGLNQAFPTLNSSEDQRNLWKFAQPLHNSGIILVFEVGFCIILLLFIYFILESNTYSLFFFLFTLNLPLLYLDHYVMTHLMGQYFLSILALFFVFVIKNKRA